MGKAINRFCIPFLFALLACTNETKQLDIALQQAKDNKEELEKVLTHFENDSLKYRAACFLIENMPYHDYYEGEGLEKYLKYFEVYSDGKHKSQQIVDSLKKTDGEFSLRLLSHKYDIQNIDSALLVHNIEWAFKVWQEQRGERMFVLMTFVNSFYPIEWEMNLLLNGESNYTIDIIRCLTVYAISQKPKTRCLLLNF